MATSASATRCRVYVSGVAQRCANDGIDDYDCPGGRYRVCATHLAGLLAGKPLRFACAECGHLEEACTCERDRIRALPPVVSGSRAEFEARRRELKAVGFSYSVNIYCDSCSAEGPALDQLGLDPKFGGWFLGMPLSALEPVLFSPGQFVSPRRSGAFRFVEGAHFLALCPGCLAVYDDLLQERGLSRFSLGRAPP